MSNIIQPTKFRCLIVDDELPGRELIAMHLTQLPEFEVVASCNSAIEAHRILRTEHIDLLFLDIEMPVLKGTDFYQSLVHKPYVIFTTAYRDYAIEGFELNAIDFLLKPIVFSRFFQAIEKYKQRLSQPVEALSDHTIEATVNSDSIFVRENRKHVRIVLNQIRYVEGLKDYIKIYMDDGSHIIKSTLTGFAAQLNDRFVRVHRSFIVNLTKITAYSAHSVELQSTEIPLSDSYRAQLQHKLRQGSI